MPAPAPGARPPLAQTAALSWARSMGLQALFASGEGYLVRDLRSGVVRLEWAAVERTVGNRPVFADVEIASGAVTSSRSFAHWSGPPTAQSHVLVAPDILTFLLLRQATVGESIWPFVIVAPVPGSDLPPEWSDQRYWGFERITILSDTLSHPSPTLPLAAEMALPNAGVATPPFGVSWRAWASGTRRVGYSEFKGIERGALPVASFGVERGNGDPDWLRRRCHLLDDEGRICRLAYVDWPGGGGLRSGHRPIVVRSDRTYASVAAPPIGASRGSTAKPALGWSSDAAAAFVNGAAPMSATDIGEWMASLFDKHVGNAASARMLSACVALTYLFPLFPELPVLLVRAGTPVSRLATRRLLTALCHQPSMVTRTRAAQLARIADAGGAVMIMDEPGPLCGPHGPTEVGRFLEACTLPDTSSYQALTSRHGLRPLEVFGPRIVVMAQGSAAGLACAVTTIDLSATEAETVAIDLERCDQLRNALNHWSLAASAKLLDRAGCLDGQRVLPMLAQELFGNVATTCPRHKTEEPRLPAVAAPPEPTPTQLMEDVLAACGRAGHVAMIQVMLEIALRGAGGEALSPERVGRWLSSHPKIDQQRAISRRRLHGQISRIYPLIAGNGQPSDASEAFGFCADRPCGGCRYEQVCPVTFPELRRRKQAL